MTCQIGSEEPPSRISSVEQKRRTVSKEAVETSARDTLDITPHIHFLFFREDRCEKSAAVMYTRVAFFTVIVALIGASAAADSGKFATSHCAASG